MRAMLFDEAFALHFLEDVFAAGHVAGSWGDVSQRKGTHDFYNQNGIEVFTWKGREKTIVLMGDAHMRPQDAALAAESVRKSIAQVLDAAAGRSRGYRIPHAATAAGEAGRLRHLQERHLSRPWRGPRHRPGAIRTSSGGRAAGYARAGAGSWPGRASARAQRGRPVHGARWIDQRARRERRLRSLAERRTASSAGLDLGFRVGLGLEGALGDAGDGLAFLQVGFTADGPSTNKISDTGLGSLGGSLSAAIPARSGLSTRIRMPYYLIPGDLLFLSPMYFFNPEKYTQLAVTASNGGLFGWQQGWATGIGRFQFVLGRELGVTFYGLWGDTPVGRAACAPRRRWARGQLQVDVLRPADPRVPTLPRILRKPELDRLVPVVRRRRRA